MAEAEAEAVEKWAVRAAALMRKLSDRDELSQTADANVQLLLVDFEQLGLPSYAEPVKEDSCKAPGCGGHITWAKPSPDGSVTLPLRRR